MESTPLKSGLPERVREALRGQIVEGRWRDVLPSERVLSCELQVSRPTIHLALLSLQTEGLVRLKRGAPWQLTVSPSAVKTSRQRRPEVLLLRNATIRPQLLALMPLIESLRSKLLPMGYGINVRDPLAYGVDGLNEMLRKMETEIRPAFYLLASLPPVVHQWFESRKLPAIIIGTRGSDAHLPAIDADPAATIRHAVQYLARRGHRRLALLDLPSKKLIGADLMYDAFRNACASWPHGRIDWMIENSFARAPTLESAIERIIKRTPRPTAVIVTDAELAIGLYTILAELGLKIPRDMSVLCFYHWPVIDALRPLPTCYKVSWERFASQIVRIVDQRRRLGTWPADRSFNLFPKLREGQSVARS